MSSITRRFVPPSLLLLLLFLSVFGCGDDAVTPEGEDPPDTTVDSPDELALFFKTTLGDRDGDVYETLLHPHFQFFFLTGEGPVGSWGKTDDVAAMRNLFSGDPPPNPDDATQNRGISSIVVDRMEKSEQWTDVLQTDAIWGDVPGARRAVYSLRVLLMHDDGTISLNNSQILYAAPTAVAGSADTTWSLIGQQELAAMKDNDGLSFGEVKNMFSDDVSSPVVHVTYPADGAHLTDAEYVTVDAADDDGIAYVEFLIDNQVVGTDDTAPYRWFWNVPFWMDHPYHRLRARAYDTDGVIGFSTGATIWMPEDSVTPSITSPYPGRVLPPGDHSIVWDTFPGAVAYEFQLGLNSLEEPIFTQTLESLERSLEFGDEGLFVTRVRAIDENDRTTSWSDPCPFRIAETYYYPLANTPEQLIDNYAVMLERQEFGFFNDIYCNEFTFHFQQGYEPLTVFDVNQEYVWLRNLCLGLDLVNADGWPVQGVLSVELDELTMIDPWYDVPITDPDYSEVYGARMARYEIALLLHQADQTIRIESELMFYAYEESGREKASPSPHWLLIGQRDLSREKTRSEDFNFSDFKVLFHRGDLSLDVATTTR